MIKGMPLAFLFCLCGCATIVNGQYQTVGLETKPSGAECAVGDDFKVITPAAITLRRGRVYPVTCRNSAGEARGAFGMKHNWSETPDFILGVVPVFADLFSHALYDVTPTVLRLDLNAAPQTPPALADKPTHRCPDSYEWKYEQCYPTNPALGAK